MAMRNNFIGYFFAHARIENKVFADELIFQTLRFDLTGVINNSTVKLVNILETLVLKPCTSLLTANSTSAVEENFFVLLTGKHLRNDRQFIAKRIYVGA